MKIVVTSYLNGHKTIVEWS